jgi:hypothetical protein
VLFGGPPQLGVNAAVGGEVEHGLPGHPGEVLGPLHDGDRVHERLEVALERAGRGCLGEPRPECVGLGRQLVADLGGDLGDSGRPDPAVEVLVERDLGCRGDLLSSGSTHSGSPGKRSPDGQLLTTKRHLGERFSGVKVIRRP